MAPLYIVVPQDKIVHEYTVRIAVQVVVGLEEWWSSLVHVRGLQKCSCLGTTFTATTSLVWTPYQPYSNSPFSMVTTWTPLRTRLVCERRPPRGPRRGCCMWHLGGCETLLSWWCREASEAREVWGARDAWALY